MESAPVTCVPRPQLPGVAAYRQPRLPLDLPLDLDSTTMARMFFQLESESDIELSETESVDSAQMELTASCQDTPDTESSSLSDTEMSPASVDSGSVSLPEISSGPEDNAIESFRPLSKSQHRCVKCHMTISSPFLHCRRCYKDRKRFLPPRPTLRKKKRREGSCSVSSKESSPSNSTEEDNFSSQPVEEVFVNRSLCAGCMSAPCNGIFIHGELGHQLFCYVCAHRIWMERKACPYCNRPITKVVKLFKVDMD
ncbi:hypothetical protein ONE63_003624 [Megalurothrips usitatus]|uniref:E3 ubiquitin-protein ligase Mdm2-like n=1 Tax=Megalurothrips usitatus TaxID=439358 RepID=A0AAV7X9G9_9NEOP|nr:hypothetical protein ONE63_003624 [Megalurothrips usitatus]